MRRKIVNVLSAINVSGLDNCNWGISEDVCVDHFINPVKGVNYHFADVWLWLWLDIEEAKAFEENAGNAETIIKVPDTDEIILMYYIGKPTEED